MLSKGVKNMARFRSKSRSRGGKRKLTIPLAIVAGFIPAISDVMNTRDQYGGLLGAIKHTGAGLIGYDTNNGNFVGWRQAKAAGAGGILVGLAVHFGAQKLGINRMIAQAGIPVIRI